MSWTADIWSQEETINSGYPFITDAGITEAYNYLSVKSVLQISPEQNQGYLFIEQSGIAEKYNYLSVKSVWKIKGTVNDGYPYILAIDDEKSVAPVFSAFSMSGMGAGFHQMLTSENLEMTENIVFSLPEQKKITFSFRMEDR